MTLLTLSCETWQWAHLIGPLLNLIPALAAFWYAARIDLKKGTPLFLAVVIYVGSGLIIYGGLKAARAAEIVTIADCTIR